MDNDDDNLRQEWPMRFVHRFKCGIIATATITESGQYDVQWSRRPSRRKTEREYLAWRETIFAMFSEVTGIEVLLVNL
jgi:hypothetical protein